MHDRTGAASAAIETLRDAAREARRLLRLHFPHGDGPDDATLLVARLDADEGLSRDFRFEVELLADRADLELKSLMGRLATVSLARDDGSLRHFSGHVFDLRFVRNDAGLAHYAMTLRPWLAFLRLRRDSRVFHGRSVEEQTARLLGACEASDWRSLRLAQEAPLTDAFQHEESDYNYLHRRWEERGWHYWYEHRADGHTLVLCGDSTACEPIDGAAPDIAWRGEGGLQGAGVTTFSAVRRLASTRYGATSFDFRQPRPAHVELPSVNRQGRVPDLGVHEHAGAYAWRDAAAGDARARLRLEEIEGAAKHFEAAGSDDRVQPGRWFRLAGQRDAAWAAGLGGASSGSGADAGDDEFLVREVHHRITNNHPAALRGGRDGWGGGDGRDGSRGGGDGRGSGSEGDGGTAAYRHTLVCLRRKIPWRPGRGFNSTATRIHGVQTALVVGPPGEEVHTDEHGRVRVQFHWDREGALDERSSAFVRVAGAWAGGGFGEVALPPASPRFRLPSTT